MLVLRTTIALATAAALLLPLGPSSAQQQKATPQQELMKTCNADAGARNLSGDARKTFMSDCLSGKTTPAAGSSTPQERMKSCNTSANDRKLDGDARKTFMSSCLKG